MTTHRAVLVRHIAARHSCISFHIIRVKVTVMTLGTDIVRTQRIYFRNSRHGSNERGTYRSTGAYQIAVIIGFPHQLLGNDVHHGESISDDGLQFPLQTLRYHFRQIISVNLVGFVVTDLTQRLVRIWNDRRALIRTHR